MNRKLKILLVLLSVGLNIAFISLGSIRYFKHHSQPRLSCSKSDTCDINCPLYKELGLKDKQWRMIAPLIDEYNKEKMSIEHGIYTSRESLFTLLESPNTDSISITRHQNRIIDHQKRLQDILIKLILKEKSSLSKEQSTKLISMLKMTVSLRKPACCEDDSKNKKCCD
jgi:hypothetical protein